MRVHALTAALACCVGVAACGASGNPGTGASASSKPNAAVKFSQCMRSHGVSDFPDPNAQGNIAISPGEVQSPAFQSAQSACRQLLPNKGHPPQMTASQRAAALRFAECMRTHGEPDFPDPSDGTPGTTGPMLVLHGMTFAVGTGLDPRSPAFRQAAQRCGIGLPNEQPRGVG